MTNVLVCIKRVPDAAGEVLLTADEQALDARFVGFTVSAHENCAVELAVRIAGADGGTATVLSLGPAETVEQLRAVLGVGCSAAVLSRPTRSVSGPPTSPARSRRSSRPTRPKASTYDLILLGNDAADTGDFQVGIRLAYELGRPVVNGVRTVEVAGGVATAHGDGIDGVETYEVPLPAVVTVLEGGVEPRYPTITGRMKAKKTPIETVEPRQRAARPRTGAAHVAARPAQHGRRARRGPRRRGRGGRPAAAPGGGPMILVFVETGGGRRHRGVAGDRHVRALARRADRRTGARRASSARCPRRSPTSSAPTASPRCTTPTATRSRPTPGPRGPRPCRRSRRRPRRRRARRRHARGAWRCSRTWPRGSTWRWRPTSSASGATDPLVVTRQVQGGAVLEEMRLPERPACSRSPGTPSRPPRPRRRAMRGARALPRGGRGRPPGPGRVHRARGPGRVRRAHLGAGRGRRGPRCRGRRRVRRRGRAGRAAGRRAGRLPRGDQPGLAPAPRADRPDRQPDLPRGLHPLRDQRRHPALGGLLELQDDPRHQHRRERADGHQGHLRRHRRHGRGRPRDQRRDPEAAVEPWGGRADALLPEEAP